MAEKIEACCANCPYTSRDRKIVYEIEYVKNMRQSGSKSAKNLISVKNALDSIFKFDATTSPSSQPQDQIERQDGHKIGVCEDCVELLTELYTAHQQFAGPRAFNSYVATEIRKMTPIIKIKKEAMADTKFEKSETKLARNPAELRECKNNEKFLPRVHLTRLGTKEIETATKKRWSSSSNTGQPKGSMEMSRVHGNVISFYPNWPHKIKEEAPTPDWDFLKEERIIDGHQISTNFDPAHCDYSATIENAGTNVADEKGEDIAQLMSKLVDGHNGRKKKGGIGGGSREKKILRLSTLKCPICVHTTKMYPNTRDFYLHLCVHISETPHSKGENGKKNDEVLQCPLCPSKLRRSGLYPHVRVHANYKPYKCQVLGCTNSFSTSTELKSHSKGMYHGPDVRKKLNSRGRKGGGGGCKKKKTKEVYFPKISVCQFCDKKCKGGGSLADHIRRIHTNDRPFRCDLCQRAFIKPADLQDHGNTLLHRRMVELRGVPPSQAQDGGHK